ncbi:MAG: nitrite reductase small subunit NirD [Cellvibrionaceae bacterium]
MKNERIWITVGKRSDLVPGSGVGARLGDRQIALFWIPELDDSLLGKSPPKMSLFAVSNYCPFSGVHIIARGIVGDIKGEPVVASPLYKQHFSLVDGRCIEQPEVSLDTWGVRLQGNALQVREKTAEATAA